MQGQLGHQPIRLAIDAVHLHLIAHAQRRLQKPVHEQFWQGIRHPHGEPLAPAHPAPVHHLPQLPAE